MFSFYNLLLLFFFALGALRSKSHSLEAASVDGHRIRPDIPAFEWESGEMQEEV
jgi:hypothetical protein